MFKKMAVYSKNNVKTIIKLCGQIAELLIINVCFKGLI